MSRDTLGICRYLCQASARNSSGPLIFLYQTRTLLDSVHKHVGESTKRSKQHISTSGRYQAIEEKSFRKSSTTNAPPLRLPESTITAPERAIFDRIFKKLVTGQKPTADSHDHSHSESLEEKGSDNESLESIFNEALIEVKKRPQKAPSFSNRRILKDLPQSPEQPRGGLVRRSVSDSRIAFRSVLSPSLQQSLDSARETYAAHRFRNDDADNVRGFRRIAVSQPENVEDVEKKPADEYERLVEETRKEDMSRVTALFDAAKTDIEIWRVLEKEVFSRATELNALLKKEEKVKNAATAKVKGRPSRKPELPGLIPPTPSLSSDIVEATPSGSIERSHEESNTPTTQEALSEDTQNTSSELASAAAMLPVSNIPAAPHPLSILQTNYAPLLSHAMQLLRTRFPTSTYAPALIAHIKRLGPVSYVLGASTTLYNELLYLRWVHYRDLHACADLVQEMLEQGIGTDRITGKVFKDAEKSWENARKSRGSDLSGNGQKPPGISYAWWDLQGVSSGWERWREAEGEAVRERSEERERRERERMEMERDEEVGVEYMDPDPDLDIALAGDARRTLSSL
ncbi:hypothetical protein MMC26_002115 [Xylographa opegraphella]|nr:hypothetical protein [Xylographa opegraphella]